MAGGRQSYFSEKRDQYHDPNFFNRMQLEELRKNVKRIIRDVKYELIQEQDYAYFTNTKILDACLHESHDQYIAARTRAFALSYYINNGLNCGYKPFPTTNIMEERLAAAEAQKVENNRYYVWENIYKIFYNIRYYGAEITTSLRYITSLSNSDIANL